MKMDLTNMISNGTEETQVPEQKLTKEEYAAKKQQEREEVWAEVEIGRASCRERCTGTGRVPEGRKTKGISRFYGRVQYPENTESAFDLWTASGF